MKNKYFLRWWLLVCCFVTGMVFLQLYDMFTRINHCDVTKISFLILFLFLIFTVQVGIETRKPTAKSIGKKEIIDWYSDKFFLLGMLGTVIGFIYVLNTCFVNIDVSNPATMQASITQMSYGMGTALYTTASGMVCGLFLKLQLFNLKMAIEASDA